MPISEARKRANQKWNDANLKDRYDHIHVAAPKGLLAEIKAARGEQSVNSYIVEAVQMRMNAEKEGRS